MSDIITCSPGAAARFIGLSKRRVYDLLAAGSIRAKVDGRRTLVIYKTLEDYVAGLPERDGEREPLFPKTPPRAKRRK